MMLPMRWTMLILTALPMTCQATTASAAPLPDAAISLRQDIQRELGPQHTRLSPRQTQRAMELGMDMLDQTGNWPADTQAILVVDRAPAVQRLWFVLADPAAHALVPLGMVAVSTGRPGRKEHFRTPVGIFFNDGQIYGYRALGTKNEHGIRGNGDKGMRVWDFGWQTTEDWHHRGALAVVRLEMHATDPTFLESRLGQADSEGCIRIPARVNSFIDRHGLLDRQLDLMARDDTPNARAVRALLGAEHMPGPLEGDRVVVVDSSDPQAVASDPEKARRIQDSFAQYLAASASPPAQSPTP
ncbi:L,D-transpeptidase, partial [Komagataeibacter kakiaceti]|uniref:L,D-transpeptidase n=1 Tax=Komagataeibacter kakiaceti TaxID=943261 RepID=UPI00046FD297